MALLNCLADKGNYFSLRYIQGRNFRVLLVGAAAPNLEEIFRHEIKVSSKQRKNYFIKENFLRIEKNIFAIKYKERYSRAEGPTFFGNFPSKIYFEG